MTKNIVSVKEGLKIPKGQSESVYRRRTDNRQWPIEKVQKDKQRSTKHAYKTYVCTCTQLIYQTKWSRFCIFPEICINNNNDK